MATVYSDIATAQKDSARAKDRLSDGSLLDGSLHYAVATYTFLAAPSNGDLVALCTLPENARVVPSLSSLCSDDNLCNDINVGITGNTNKYADALDLSSGGTVAFAGGDEASELPDKLSAEETIYAELVSGGTGIANGETLQARIAYILPH